MTNHEKNERINKVIEDLDLSEVADSKVLSRGEKKRTSIAMELIADPSILFLDRPTTGLHISTANTVLLLLKRISEQGPAIIFTINHPWYYIFKLFDSLTLLASGKLMYQDPAKKALEYFASVGGAQERPTHLIRPERSGGPASSGPVCQGAGRTKKSKKRRLAAQSRGRFAPICFLFRFAPGGEAECVISSGFQ
ncbi:broad substrate specificity ATP-binding cassette transporter ABCG2-like isoform X2 [Marmota flaviventris]|uniref:broad substrate specificity ATP-binding cassette transporter ABCG2-like isoform X2 n=1 Tax=Marmota flaviventris TaxID=93162 RepID=UPI003A888031